MDHAPAVCVMPEGCTFARDAARDPVVASDSVVIGGTLPGALLRTLVARHTNRSQEWTSSLLLIEGF